MMPVEIDPSEVRRPQQDSPVRARPRLGRPAMLAALAVTGVGGCAGLAAAAYPTLSDMLRPRPAQVHFGRVADMPEIKDGIPALRTTPGPVVRQVPIPPATPPAAPAALLDPRPSVPPNASAQGAGTQGATAQGASVQGASVQGSWSPSSDVAATGTAGSFQPLPAAVPKAPETPRPVATAPRETVKPGESKPGEAMTPRESAPPPARAVQARPAATPREKVADEKAAKPAPAREARVEARAVTPKPAAPKPTAEKAAPEKRVAEKSMAEKPVARREKPEAHQRSAAAQPVAPAPPPAEEPTRFLGMPMPDLAPAGRAIKETVDAVISFPSRL